MVDARYPSRWLNTKSVVRLSDSAHRTFVTTLAYVVENMTDGYLDLGDFDLILGATASDKDELIKSGLWSIADDAGIFITGFLDHQTSKAEHEAAAQKRLQDRNRKAAERAKAKQAKQSSGQSSGQSEGQSDGQGAGHQRLGKARQGKDRQGAFTGAEVKGEEDSEDPATSSSSKELCFTCGKNEVTSGSECASCSSGGSQHHLVSEGSASEVPMCAFSGCRSSARPGRVMCSMHYTREPAGGRAA